MSYKLLVGEEVGRKSGIWINYCNSFKELTTSMTSKYDLAKSNLVKYHARDVANTPYIEFDTEEDAMVFALMFR